MFRISLLIGLFGIFQVIYGSYAVIIPDSANSVEKTAAEELQYHLRKATGIEFPILPEAKVSEDITGGFKLGRVKGAASYDKAEPDTYEIRLKDHFLWIAGHDGKGLESNERTAAGTLFGVYHYLRHELGVRWLWPGETGEYIPVVDGLKLNNRLDGIYPPSFQFVRASSLLQDPEDFRWGRRVMQMSSARFPIHAGTGGHAFSKWSKLYGKEHPEWFALQKDGQRRVQPTTGMCISNDGFQTQIVKLWQQAQMKNPKTRLFINVKENDTIIRCTCPKCQSWDGSDERGPTGRYCFHPNVGERYARFYRAVWEKAAQIDPDARVSFYAYQSYIFAPRQTKLNANFYVGLVPDIPFPRRQAYNEWLRGEYRAWKASGATLYLRPNYFLSGYCMPEVWYDQYAEEFKFITELGSIGMAIDGPGKMWATRGLDYYVMGRLCAEPKANPEQLAAEFYDGFAAAAPDVKAYFEFYRDYMRKNTGLINDVYESLPRKWYFHGVDYGFYVHKIFPGEILQAGFPYLDKAAAKVQNDPAARAKIDFLRQGLEHAVASVKCAEIFATPHCNDAERAQAWKALREKRAGLPRHAVNGNLLDKVEKRAWQVKDNSIAVGGDT